MILYASRICIGRRDLCVICSFIWLWYEFIVTQGYPFNGMENCDNSLLRLVPVSSHMTQSNEQNDAAQMRSRPSQQLTFTENWIGVTLGITVPSLTISVMSGINVMYNNQGLLLLTKIRRESKAWMIIKSYKCVYIYMCVCIYISYQ